MDHSLSAFRRVAVRTLRSSGAALLATRAAAAHDAADRTDARSRSWNCFTVATVENSSRQPEGTPGMIAISRRRTRALR